MYNKIFTKILDSSIWLAPDPHRLVWITLIAAMDQNGYAQFACIENLAARARVSVDDTRSAVTVFESPDPFAPEQEFEGRRIERIDSGWLSGWLVLNADKYRNIVTRAVANEQAAARMRKHREKNAVTQQLRTVTPSGSLSVSQESSDAAPVDKSSHPKNAIKIASSEKPRETAEERQQSRTAMQRVLDRAKTA